MKIGGIMSWLSRQKTLARLARGIVYGAAALAGGVAIYACASSRALRREVLTTPRDAATGVVLGTEAVSLDPPASPASMDRPTTACLLVHGFIASRKDFDDLGERLAARGFHARLLRLPGHGTTPQDFARQTPETIYASVLEEYQALRRKYRAVDVIGFSMGGALATRLASREDVHRLVLVAPYYGVTYKWYYILPPETWNAIIAPVVAYVVKFDAFIKVNKPGARKMIYTYHCVPTRGVKTLIALGREAHRPEVLGAIQCPALMVMSEGDEAASPRAARAAFERLGSPRKESRWLTRSNHHLLWDYDNEEVKGAIVEFLGEKKN